MPSELTSSVGRFGLIAAGGYALGPIGAAAGALVGSFLFGSLGPTVEGPRLGDLSVAASTYGGVIPIGFGVQKVAGTMIWATDIEEEKRSRTVGGGLLGGGQTVIEYRYFANFAVSFGEGPAVDILRLWAGEKLLFDRGNPLGGKTSGDPDFHGAIPTLVSQDLYRFRIYPGSKDQETGRGCRRQRGAAVPGAVQGRADLHLRRRHGPCPRCRERRAAEEPRRLRGVGRDQRPPAVRREHHHLLHDRHQRRAPGDRGSGGRDGRIARRHRRRAGRARRTRRFRHRRLRADRPGPRLRGGAAGHAPWRAGAAGGRLPETRVQEVELPLRFNVLYQDADRDSDIGTQYAKRIASPDRSMHSRNEATLDLPLTLSASEAKGVALNQLHGAWLERTGHEWHLTWSHLDLEPADVVDILLDDGRKLTVRVVEATLGANFELAWKTVVEDSSTYAWRR
jgi:hypothetical protein